METDDQEICTFETFFRGVSDMLSRKILHIFYVNKIQFVKVYIHADESYTHLQNYIKEQTEVCPQHQILLLKSNLFKDIVGENCKARSYPETKEEEPLFLFDKEDNNVIVVPEQNFPRFNEISGVSSVRSDAVQAKNACVVGHVWQTLIEKCSLSCRYFSACVENFVQYFNKELKEVNLVCVCLLKRTAMLKDTAHFLESSQQLAAFKLENAPPIIAYVYELKQISDSFISQTDKKIMELNESHVIENILQSQWNTFSHSFICPTKSRAPERARMEVQRLRDSWQHMVRDCAKSSLSDNEKTVHNLERIKMTSAINRVKILLEKEVLPQYTQLAENLGEWYKIAHMEYIQLMNLKKQVLQYEINLKKFELKMRIKNDVHSAKIQKLLQQDAADNFSKKMKNEKLKMCLSVYSKESVQIKDLVQERAQIMEKLNYTLEKLTAKEDWLNL